MTKTIYIAGKVTGLPFEQVVQRFAAKEEQLCAQGHDVINPIAAVIANHWQNEPWQDIMRASIVGLMAADEIHLLPGWQDSKGAVIERNLALSLGIPIVYPQ